MEQRLLSDTSMYGLQREVNELLASGWRIVPGSVGCGITQRAAARINEFSAHTPEGVVFESHFWAVVEAAESDDDA